MTFAMLSMLKCLSRVPMYINCRVGKRIAARFPMARLLRGTGPICGILPK